MSKLAIKSTVIGFILGTVFFVIAPLGLGITFIESLKPVLVPGVAAIQLLGVNTDGALLMISALFLNGLIYTLVVFSVLAARSQLGKSE